MTQAEKDLIQAMEVAVATQAAANAAKQMVLVMAERVVAERERTSRGRRLFRATP